MCLRLCHSSIAVWTVRRRETPQGAQRVDDRLPVGVLARARISSFDAYQGIEETIETELDWVLRVVESEDEDPGRIFRSRRFRSLAVPVPSASTKKPGVVTRSTVFRASVLQNIVVAAARSSSQFLRGAVGHLREESAFLPKRLLGRLLLARAFGSGATVWPITWETSGFGSSIPFVNGEG